MHDGEGSAEREIFDRLSVLPEPERRRRLDELCGADPGLRARVEALLRHDEDPVGFIDTPPAPFAGEGAPGGDGGAAGGDGGDPAGPVIIGGYRLLRRLGAGGVGTVYEAEQASTRQLVAVKLLRAGLLSKQALRRFEHEAEILARLQAPGIARIYDAGVVDTLHGAQPYLVMERVEGEPVTAHVRGREMPVAERLELFARICDAVQEAHARGVIHRDLKPANILAEAGGQVRIIDFGVARMVDEDGRSTTLRTNPGDVVGTLPYMSPEQASGRPDAIDTRTDVYALGVVLFEMLTGRLPLECAGLPVDEAIRRIREAERPRLGTIDRALRGDVETIAAKALDRDQARRYESPAALAADVRRYLHDEPIAARAPSAVYQMRKFARRHRGLVTAAGGVVLLLLASATATTIGLAGALEGQREAELGREEAQAMNDFLVDLFESARPEFLGPDVEVREMLDHSQDLLPGPLRGHPLAEARVRDAIGRTYHLLGEFESAFVHHQAALALVTLERGVDHPDTVRPMGRMGEALKDLGKYEQAEPVLAEACDVARRVLGDDHPDTLMVRGSFASLRRHTGRFEEAAALWEDLLERHRRVHGSDHAETLIAMNNYAEVLLWLDGRLDESDRLYAELIEISERVRGSDHPDTVGVIANRGRGLVKLGRLAEAEPMLLDALARSERLNGPEHLAVGVLLSHIGQMYQHRRRFDEAVAAFERSLEIHEARYGRRHPATATVVNNLGCAHLVAGAFDRARPLLRETHDVLTDLFGAREYRVLMARGNIAGCERLAGNYAAAEAEYLELLPVAEEERGRRSSLVADVLRGLGTCQLRQGRAEEAARTLLEAGEITLETLGPEHVHYREIERLLRELELEPPRAPGPGGA